MSGRRYFLDTNAIVQLLSGNHSLLTTLAGAAYVATSVICELEFLSLRAHC
jgi:predicted nucleic acid-binding protein